MVGIITFTLVYVGPGDPAAIIAGDEATPERLEEIREDLGFNRPFPVQMGDWFWKLMQSSSSAQNHKVKIPPWQKSMAKSRRSMLAHSLNWNWIRIKP